MSPSPWNVRRLPPAPGKTFLVTGGNAGIGYFVAEQLATTGATVVLGSRAAARADAAMASISTHVPGARVRHLPLDLSDPESLKTAAVRLAVDRLDAVVCNAGMLLEEPARRENPDGQELVFATNHLGHFALVGWLAPLLTGGRVVTTGSLVAKTAQLDIDDLRFTRDYEPKEAYARSKLAQMLFGLELDRRLRATGSTTLSVVTTPGGALDSLTPARPPVHTPTTGERLRGLPAGLLLQGKHAGAWPAVRAVLDPAVQGGQLWSPRIFGLRGAPRLEPLRNKLADTALATQVWSVSAELTGVDPFA
ncbi:SDR family NAD(P)-dependent oxidoreductase [Kibdelosporangium phytohabitans]|uniref:3beta-hydroxysteroid 3-dehydrogenase n=1 Tax=Kibdelosporangium phytohabitans TaxID=860235 RepID=A0A0N9HNK8_9PSEU|nr:SDR family NAD(P)-dependent oxidoreductase [Kibdelosporangium phytohabitans]ALG08531.1 short-chain dehydrogenase [Kibdelosporangium phytohabitans]MBE1470395.1 NAD(P)-dependent dehydrogenase (short-subunit alcohol dehydrogenase family) [Kibdelosporangium phytohabitans]